MIVNGCRGDLASRLPGDRDRRILSVSLVLLDAAYCGKTRRPAFDDGPLLRRPSVRIRQKIARILAMVPTGCSSGAPASIADARAASNPWMIPFAIAKRAYGVTVARIASQVPRAE
jgi:hypothetical protein